VNSTTPVTTLAPSCADTTTVPVPTVPTTRVTIPPTVLAFFAIQRGVHCLRVDACGTAAVPGAQLDLSWVIPQSFATAPPAPLLPCGSRNCPNSGSLYSQILIWPSYNTSGALSGEVVDVQSISGCVPDISLKITVDVDSVNLTAILPPLCKMCLSEAYALSAACCAFDGVGGGNGVPRVTGECMHSRLWGVRWWYGRRAAVVDP
jgi:hypothetical protein